RASKGYSGLVTPLLESMLVQAHDAEQQQSPSRITSSPSLSQQPTQSSPSPELIQPTNKAEETASMPHDSPLHAVHSHGSDEGNSKETGVQAEVWQLGRKAKIVLSDDEEITEDSSKRGRKISQIDEDPTISLVQDEGISWIPHEEEVHEKPSDETEVIVQEETPTEIIKEHGSGEKGEMEISTASPPKVTKVSTAEAHVYIRKSAKDKGKAIIEEPATPKKVKKRTQVKLSMDEELACEDGRRRKNQNLMLNRKQSLQKEEERLNLEAARELQRQLDQRQEVPTQPTQSQGIDWNDPSVLRYHALKNRPVSIAQARRNMITYLKNQGGYKESYFKRMSYNDIRPILIGLGSLEEEKVEEEDVNPEPVLIEKKAVGIRRKTLARRRTCDKQVPDEEEFVDHEILHTKFSIVDWESQSLGNMHVYKIIRADGNTSYHKTIESMLKSFNRHDLEVLHRLVMERFQDNTPEGYNLMLWGDLKILVDPEQDDDIWKNQNQWKIISWKLYETCGVHTLMVDGTLMTIHMFVEKKYPLTKETLQKMLN
ncbi:hypothetical protein Tco_0685035, partial [Tanacetum coccineum]